MHRFALFVALTCSGCGGGGGSGNDVAVPASEIPPAAESPAPAVAPDPYANYAAQDGARMSAEGTPVPECAPAEITAQGKWTPERTVQLRCLQTLLGVPAYVNSLAPLEFHVPMRAAFDAGGALLGYAEHHVRAAGFRQEATLREGRAVQAEMNPWLAWGRQKELTLVELPEQLGLDGSAITSRKFANLHYVAGMESSDVHQLDVVAGRKSAQAPVLPVTGQSRYRLLAHTTPTIFVRDPISYQQVPVEGELTAAALTLDWSALVADLELSLNIRKVDKNLRVALHRSGLQGRDLLRLRLGRLGEDGVARDCVEFAFECRNEFSLLFFGRDGQYAGVYFMIPGIDDTVFTLADHSKIPLSLAEESQFSGVVVFEREEMQPGS